MKIAQEKMKAFKTRYTNFLKFKSSSKIKFPLHRSMERTIILLCNWVYSGRKPGRMIALVCDHQDFVNVVICQGLFDGFEKVLNKDTDFYLNHFTEKRNKAKQKYRGMLEPQKSGNKTSSGEIGLNIRTHESPKVWQDKVTWSCPMRCPEE